MYKNKVLSAFHFAPSSFSIYIRKRNTIWFPNAHTERIIECKICSIDFTVFFLFLFFAYHETPSMAFRYSRLIHREFDKVYCILSFGSIIVFKIVRTPMPMAILSVCFSPVYNTQEHTISLDNVPQICSYPKYLFVFLSQICWITIHFNQQQKNCSFTYLVLVERDLSQLQRPLADLTIQQL